MVISAIFSNLEAIMIELPDFDVEEFFVLAKKISDFFNDPRFEKWAEIIKEGMKCKHQASLTPK